jgi:predicted RNA-binding protein YlqC (UPF0109 family)
MSKSSKQQTIKQRKQSDKLVNLCQEDQGEGWVSVNKKKEKKRSPSNNENHIIDSEKNKNKSKHHNNKNKSNNTNSQLSNQLNKSIKQINHEKSLQLQVAKDIQQKEVIGHFIIPSSKKGTLLGKNGDTIRKFGEYFHVFVTIQQSNIETAEAIETTSVSTIAPSFTPAVTWDVVVTGKGEEIVQAAVEGIQTYLHSGILPWTTGATAAGSVEKNTTISPQDEDEDRHTLQTVAAVPVSKPKPWLNILTKPVIESTLSTTLSTPAAAATTVSTKSQQLGYASCTTSMLAAHQRNHQQRGKTVKWREEENLSEVSELTSSMTLTSSSAVTTTVAAAPRSPSSALSKPAPLIKEDETKNGDNREHDNNSSDEISTIVTSYPLQHPRQPLNRFPSSSSQSSRYSSKYQSEMKIPAHQVGEILGRGGYVLQTIKQYTHTNITLSALASTSSSSIAVIRGNNAEDVTIAQEIFSQILANHCHPLTHPDRNYMAMKIPHRRYFEYIVLHEEGRKVVSLEVQFGVRIFLNEHCPDRVVVVGDRYHPELRERVLDEIERMMDEVDALNCDNSNDIMSAVHAMK